ncbi:uncharacterized protein LOC118652566 [Myotis myotis]|nr:uncharacterized protein LOC118652566 [Myotis myotis]
MAAGHKQQELVQKLQEEIKTLNQSLQEKSADLEKKSADLEKKSADLEKKSADLEKKSAELEQLRKENEALVSAKSAQLRSQPQSLRGCCAPAPEPPGSAGLRSQEACRHILTWLRAVYPEPWGLTSECSPASFSESFLSSWKDDNLVPDRLAIYPNKRSKIQICLCLIIDSRSDRHPDPSVVGFRAHNLDSPVSLWVSLTWPVLRGTWLWGGEGGGFANTGAGRRRRGGGWPPKPIGQNHRSGLFG